MAVIEEVAQLGNSFSLGHWGDVLFDSDGYQENLSEKELLRILKKKVVKKGGIELASALWKNWKLEGDFETYLDKRISMLLTNIKIDNANAKKRTKVSL